MNHRTPLLVAVALVAGPAGSILVRPLVDGRPANAQNFVPASDVGRYQLVVTPAAAGGTAVLQSQKHVIDTKTGEVWEVVDNSGRLTPRPWPRLGKPGGVR